MQPSAPLLRLLLPLALGVAAYLIGHLALKMAVPATCAFALLASRDLRRSADTWFVVAAFGFSTIGDAFLSTRAGRESFYVGGIVGFFFAHAGYLAFALRNGRVHGPVLVGLLAGYLAWFAWRLAPAIGSPVLATAALCYLVISCVTLAAALGLRLPVGPKAAYVAGIALIVFSDTLIARGDFLGKRSLNFLILPTYYLAQIAVAAALLLGRASPPRGREERPGKG